MEKLLVMFGVSLLLLSQVSGAEREMVLIKSRPAHPGQGTPGGSRASLGRSAQGTGVDHPDGNPVGLWPVWRPTPPVTDRFPIG